MVRAVVVNIIKSTVVVDFCVGKHSSSSLMSHIHGLYVYRQILNINYPSGGFFDQSLEFNGYMSDIEIFL